MSMHLGVEKGNTEDQRIELILEFSPQQESIKSVQSNGERKGINKKINTKIIQKSQR